METKHDIYVVGWTVQALNVIKVKIIWFAAKSFLEETYCWPGLF